MVYMGKSFGDIVAGRKSTSDFMNEAQELERVKRAQAMQEEMMPLQLEQAKLGLEKARKDATAPQMPFEGTGFDSQVGNIAYEKFLKETGDPMAARQMAADAVLGTKVTPKMVQAPDGSMVMISEPRAPMFGSMHTPAINPNAPHPLDDPMQANQQAAAQQAIRVGGYNPNAELMPVDMTQADVEAQLAGMDVGTIPQGDDLMNMPFQDYRKLMEGIPDAGPKTKQLAQEEAVKAAARSYDPKIEAEKQGKEAARSRVTSLLTDIAGYYDSLQSTGALVDSNKPVLENILARARSSGAGKLVEGAIGTEAQDYRNMIEASRPLLVQEIRKANEMGAKGMDSNVELNFYLQAATDVSRSAKANKAALASLNEAYGLGATIDASQDAKEELRKEFQQRMQRLDGGQQSPMNIDINSMTEEELDRFLAE